MGIIQSGINNALTGTAFLLGTSGALGEMKADYQAGKALRGIDEATEQKIESINFDKEMNQWGDKDPNKLKASNDAAKSAIKQIRQQASDQKLDIMRTRPKYAAKVAQMEGFEIAKQSLLDRTQAKSTQQTMAESFRERLKNPSIMAKRVTDEFLKSTEGGNN